jgi:hypothetical protein
MVVEETSDNPLNLFKLKSQKPSNHCDGLKFLARKEGTGECIYRFIFHKFMSACLKLRLILLICKEIKCRNRKFHCLFYLILLV